MKVRHIIILSLITTLALSLMACSTAKVRVLPGEDGNHQVIARDIEKDDAEEAALKGAQEYCEKFKKEAVFSKRPNETKYTGSMKEDTRNTVRKASKAAMILAPAGGMAAHSGGAGAILGGAGMVGHTMTNDRDYSSELFFKCK